MPRATPLPTARAREAGARACSGKPVRDEGGADCRRQAGGGHTCAAQFPEDADSMTVSMVNAANSTVAHRGTERDWLQFLWGWNTGPAGTPLNQIAEAYRQVCNPGQCIDSEGKRMPKTDCELSLCEGSTLVWNRHADDKSFIVSFRDGVVGYFNAEVGAGDTAAVMRRDRFLEMAEQRGVDESLDR